MGQLRFEDQPIRLVGGRRFWAARIPGGADRAEVDAELRAAFDEHEAQHVRGEGAIGVAVVLDPDAVAERPADAYWRDTKLLYAGYRPDGHQVRVRYFKLALCIEPGPEGPLDFDPAQRSEVFALGDDHEVHPIGDGTVTEADVIDFWAANGELDPVERERRIRQVRAVATTREGDIVAVGSAYRMHHEQTRLDLWAARVFVAPDHRRSNLATLVNDRTLDAVTAEPDGAAGLIMEIANERLRTRLARAVMPTRPFTFIGARPDGATVFVSYFDGVLAPEPPR